MSETKWIQTRKLEKKEAIRLEKEKKQIESKFIKQGISFSEIVAGNTTAKEKSREIVVLTIPALKTQNILIQQIKTIIETMV